MSPDSVSTCKRRHGHRPSEACDSSGCSKQRFAHKGKIGKMSVHCLDPCAKLLAANAATTCRPTAWPAALTTVARVTGSDSRQAVSPLGLPRASELREVIVPPVRRLETNAV